MAVPFVLAVAADRKVGMMGQRGEQLESVVVLWSRHFLPVLPDERRPPGWSLGCLSELHSLVTRRKVGEPHVVPVLRCEL